MKYNGACKSLHKRSYLTIIMVHARSMLLYQDSIKNTEASNHHKLNIKVSFQKTNSYHENFNYGLYNDMNYHSIAMLN